MRRGLSILGGLALGVALSQFPEYAQQYTQRLGGAVDELRIITTEFDAAAKAGGLTREQALARYDTSTDSFLKGRGSSMQQTFARYDQLSGMLAQIRGANASDRLSLLPQFVDTEIGQRTLDSFKPAVPVTIEGFAYAGVGLVLGYAVVSILISFLLLPFRRRRRIVYRQYDEADQRRRT
ncbi:MAG: Methyl-accepting chemotaxis protein [Hyphomicrobiales bacterium]|jgi:hypothetical protein|nr:Methyl-accepting chemotaxis protein [Hyphomicrobiales bacterium]